MKNRPGRRSFLKKLSVGSLGATIVPGVVLSEEKDEIKKGANPEQKTAGREFNGAYSGDYLKRIAMPIGGMGAGMFCVEGTGAISHMSVHNKSQVFHEPGMFGAVSIKGAQAKARVLEGPVPDWKGFGQPSAGN
ncbi:MAG: hypothetical protein WKF87_06485 [Chryseolinea sp.]